MLKELRKQKGITSVPTSDPGAASDMSPDEIEFQRLYQNTPFSKSDYTSPLADIIFQRGSTRDLSDIWDNSPYVTPSRHSPEPVGKPFKKTDSPGESTPSTKAPSPGHPLVIDLEDTSDTDPLPAPPAPAPTITKAEHAAAVKVTSPNHAKAVPPTPRENQKLHTVSFIDNPTMDRPPQPYSSSMDNQSTERPSALRKPARTSAMADMPQIDVADGVTCFNACSHLTMIARVLMMLYACVLVVAFHALVCVEAHPVTYETYEERQKLYARFKRHELIVMTILHAKRIYIYIYAHVSASRQLVGEVACEVPDQLKQAWQDACKSRSKTAKNHLFNTWLRAGGDWGQLLTPKQNNTA